MRANGWTNVARTSERGGERGASGRANDSTIVTSLVLLGDMYIQPVPKLLYTYYTTQEYWYKVVGIRNPCNFEGGPTPLRAHEGVARRGRTYACIRTHARTHVRVHVRTHVHMHVQK